MGPRRFSPMNSLRVSLALAQLDMITATSLWWIAFMRYMNDTWKTKATMWCLGARKSIPHGSQNTNFAIELYHSNLKSIFNIVKKYFVGRHIDWLIYHLSGMWLHTIGTTSNVRLLGLFKRKNMRVFFCVAIIWANAIPDANVLVLMNKDVLYVGPVNNWFKVWTIHSLDSTWATTPSHEKAWYVCTQWKFPRCFTLTSKTVSLWSKAP